MKTRILTSAVIVAVLLPVFIFSDTVAYPIVLGLLGLCSVFEVLRVLGVHKVGVIAAPAYLIAALAPVGAFFFKGRPEQYFLVCAGVLFFYMLYLFAVAVFERGSYPFVTYCEALVMTIYITLSYTSMTLVRYCEHGGFYFVLVFAAAWVTDVFAYFSGTLFGRHKLIPEVSPKKTVEGSIGGILFATLSFLLAGLIAQSFFGIRPNYPVLAAAGFVLSIVSQIGDLVASLVKREHGVKDYGKLLPGHGGIMDRFDSVLAVSTALFLLVTVVPLCF